MDDQKLVLNFFGNPCNYISVPLEEDEEKVADTLVSFMYQTKEYEDPIDYPVYYGAELRTPAPGASTSIPEGLKSELKIKLSKVLYAVSQTVFLMTSLIKHLNLVSYENLDLELENT